MKFLRMTSLTLVTLAVAAASAFADTAVKQFSHTADYAKFLQANPKIKVIAVTPVTDTTDVCPNDNQLYCGNVHTVSLLVTYEL